MQRIAIVMSALIASIGLTAGSISANPILSSTIPFTIDEIYGHRPVVNVVLGKMKYRMVIHSNAGFHVQLDHRHAAAAGAYALRHVGAFGIEAAGKVSPLGRDEGLLPVLSIAGRKWRGVPASIFETPGDTETGMLGLNWITKNRAVVDYSSQTLIILPSSEETATRDRSLRKAGFVSVPMSRDASDGRYYVTTTIGAVSRKMAVSTVASLVIDDRFARTAGVPIGGATGEYGGPTGAVGHTYPIAGPIRLSIGSWKSRPTRHGSVEDTYAYMGKRRPKNPELAHGGLIGADFLIRHHAVIDFGRSKLYLR